jgi:radical SAM superfamily enzyme YgiQ (UPF0313 family)
MMDIVLINPGDRKQVFQGLGQDISAIEPPFWVAVLAAFLRNQGFNVAIIDSNAENISPEETAERVKKLDPLLAAVIVYGSQPSASTQNMSIAGKICQALKSGTNAKVAIGGLHPSALPLRTLEEDAVDFVIDGEGPFTLEKLLHELRENRDNWADINGLWWHDNAGKVCHTERFPIIKDLDEVLPVAAWDLLPMDKYRAHNWHCFDDIEHRQPYGAIYTSLGCPFNCVFCCINAPFGKPAIRYRSPERVMEEIRILVEQYGVKNLKIVDELFVLKKQHYMTILEAIIEKGYDLNMWVYARIDTVEPEVLRKMKQAGVNWIALGIESANPDVRDGASKQMRENGIKEVVRRIQDAGIRVIGNFIFGLPDDTLETMQQTLDMAIELNCEFANFYSAMAYPGSKLYDIALEKGWELPDSWHAFSQHAYDTKPLPTKYLSAEQVLKFRDDAFHQYFENPDYLKMFEKKFGKQTRSHIEEITKTRLKRALYN